MLPFNKPHIVGREFDYIRQAIEENHLSGNGSFTKRCQAALEQQVGCARALLTHSCTGALEMAALLLDLEPGDEVILPSFTFVSTANAFALRGAKLVFVDVSGETFNIDPHRIEAAITERTRAICVVHYAGVGCDMDAIGAIAERHGLPIVEDAAQAAWSTYRGKPLGGIGALGTLSFHETKNIISGEGGALLVNDPSLADRAEIIWEKGTNRSAFFRGQIDKYTWVDIGSSFLPSELNAAFLWAQFERGAEITETRLAIWDRYYAAFEEAESQGRLRRPIIPAECQHNAHMFYILTPSQAHRAELIKALRAQGAHAVFHYVPLHSSVAGERFGRTHGPMTHTDDVSERLLRLPLWPGLADDQVDHVVDVVLNQLP